MPQTLQDWAGAGPDGKATLALVFTDIVGSTDLANKMGDKKWFEIVRSHFAKARQYKDEFRGYEIKLIGDAYMVAFRTADQAFEFAWKFYNDTGDALIRIRIGINSGQVRIFENDLLGVMINFTSRIQHQLKGHGILLSDSAKTDVIREFGLELPGLTLRPWALNIKSFGRQTVWFVARRLTPLQESSLGRGIRKYILNESELIPPIPNSASAVPSKTDSNTAQGELQRPRIRPRAPSTSNQSSSTIPERQGPLVRRRYTLPEPNKDKK